MKPLPPSSNSPKSAKAEAAPARVKKWGKAAALPIKSPATFKWRGHGGAVPAAPVTSQSPPPDHPSPFTGCSEATGKRAQADLARSGISPVQALAEGIFVTDDASAVNPDFDPEPAIIIPYSTADGDPQTYTRDGRLLLFCRARYLPRPSFTAGGKKKRYTQPGDSGTPPYFARSVDWQEVQRSTVPEIYVTEGEKKAIALNRAGFLTVGVGGVFNFGEGSAPLHSEFAAIAAKCERVNILFDSDAATNPDIQNAEWRLAGQLSLLGCAVRVVRLPPSDATDAAGKPAKVGADDYLMEHGPAALRKLVDATPALGDRAASPGTRISVAELLKHEVTPVEEIIPGWIEKGIPNFLCGAGGVHKSRLAMQWGLVVNAGASVWGLEPALAGVKKPKATLVYVSAEDDANELARRAQAICRALKIKSAPQGLFVPRQGKDSALVLMHESAETEVRPFYHELVALLRSITGHKLAVLDSAYDFVRFVGRAKIDEDSVNFYIKVLLQGICDQCDTTLLIPWHPSQAGSERANQDGWSVAWHNAPRLRLGLKALGENEPDTYELSVTKRNHGKKGDPIKIRYCDGALLPLDSIPDSGKAEALRQVCVRAAIEAAGHGIPINRRDYVRGPIFKDAEAVLGRRPTKQEIMSMLEDAVRAGELRYLPTSRHRAAGFYPPDEAAALDLAHAAKRAARSNADA
jgi:AAA domain-containing protein/uncharacterized protein DUF3854